MVIYDQPELFIEEILKNDNRYYYFNVSKGKFDFETIEIKIPKKTKNVLRALSDHIDFYFGKNASN